MNLMMKLLLADTTVAASASGTGAAGSAGIVNTLFTFLPLILIVVLMYFMLIRPQKKKQKEEKQMRDSLRVGDELTTIGGVCGRVVSIKDDTITIETGADRTKMQFKKWAIQSVDTKHDAPADDDDDDDDDI